MMLLEDEKGEREIDTIAVHEEPHQKGLANIDSCLFVSSFTQFAITNTQHWSDIFL